VLPILISTLLCHEALGDGCKPLRSVKVPTDGSVVAAHGLKANAKYRVRAAGVFFVGGPGYADAEYGFDCEEKHFQDKCIGGNPVDLGIAVNDTSGGPAKSTRWGAYRRGVHDYVIEAQAQANGSFTFRYKDCYYPDNHGDLLVEIYAPDCGAAIAAGSGATAPDLRASECGPKKTKELPEPGAAADVQFTPQRPLPKFLPLGRPRGRDVRQEQQ
jgi:hypothetical protein